MIKLLPDVRLTVVRFWLNGVVEIDSRGRDHNRSNLYRSRKMLQDVNLHRSYDPQIREILLINWRSKTW